MDEITLTKEELNNMIEEEVSGLKNKNSELLDKLKKYKGVDVEEYTTLKETVRTLEESKLTEQEKLAKKIEKQSELIKSLTEKNNKYSNKIDNMKKSIEIQNAISGIGYPVKDGMSEPLSLYLKEKMTVVDDNYVIDGKDVKSFVSEWVKADGKHFFKIDNVGGSSSGNITKSDLEQYSKYFDKGSDGYNITKQVQLKNSNPELYETLSKKYK
jgi:predicted RNase H-like nuclease (RuvC/YqgF family)